MSVRLSGRVRGSAADELVTGRVWHGARRGHKGGGTVPRSLKASAAGWRGVERHGTEAPCLLLRWCGRRMGRLLAGLDSSLLGSLRMTEVAGVGLDRDCSDRPGGSLAWRKRSPPQGRKAVAVSEGGWLFPSRPRPPTDPRPTPEEREHVGGHPPRPPGGAPPFGNAQDTPLHPGCLKARPTARLKAVTVPEGGWLFPSGRRPPTNPRPTPEERERLAGRGEIASASWRRPRNDGRC
jgi:hypothetical protein